MDFILNLIGRESELFGADVQSHEAELSRIVASSRFLVIGGAGSIGQSPTSKPVEITVPVVTEGRFNTPEQFDDIILRTDPDGAAIVRLGDVGRAEEGLQNYMMRPSLNGKPAVFISVYQQPGSNALAVAQGVRDTLEKL